MTNRTMTRRMLLATLASAAALALPAAALAAAPKVATQAPGFYRVMVGDIEVTALSDGTVDLPVDSLLTNTTPERVKAALSASFLDLPLRTSNTAFLLNTGERLILVDTGAGALFGPTLGKLPDSLTAAGYRPDQIDDILITHMHPDHIGGLSAGDRMAFPNATLRASRDDAETWLSTANLASAPVEQKAFFEGPIGAVAPYQAAGRFEPFDGGARIADGVTAVPLPGHTAGHFGYLVESKGDSLLIWGDVVHVAAVQFADPAVTIAFDSDAAAAGSSRLALFKDVAAKGTLIAGAHLPFPGLGHVRPTGDAFAWVPADYSSTP